MLCRFFCGEKKRATKKEEKRREKEVKKMSKKAAEKKPEVGICFPIDSEGILFSFFFFFLSQFFFFFTLFFEGGRSTQIAGKNILASAIRGVKSSKAEEYATLCEKEKKWRFKYNKHLMNMVKLSALR